jgi:CheY-like chemotaxis protein
MCNMNEGGARRSILLVEDSDAHARIVATVLEGLYLPVLQNNARI